MSNSKTSDKYLQRGVSASKEDVHNAIKNLDKGLFPKAFCKIVPDYLTGSDDHCIVMHADGAGTKSSLAYMYWKETGDLSVWKGIAQDALIMNIDDLICVGATENIMLSSTIGRNKNKIPGEVISAIINGTKELVDDLKDSFSNTVENTSKLLTNMLRTIESTVSDDEIKNEAKEIIQDINEELKNLIDETKNKYLGLFEDNLRQEEE